MKPIKSLGIKIGTETEVLWLKVKEEAEFLIKQSNNNLIIQTAMRDLAKTKILEEKEKFK